MNTLSSQRPRPSIDTRMPASFSTLVNRGEVNWLPSMGSSPWIRRPQDRRSADRRGVGVEDLRAAMASQGLFQGFQAELDLPVSCADIPPGDRFAIVFDTRQASTLRLAQSMTATR